MDWLLPRCLLTEERETTAVGNAMKGYEGGRSKPDAVERDACLTNSLAITQHQMSFPPRPRPAATSACVVSAVCELVVDANGVVDVEGQGEQAAASSGQKQAMIIASAIRLDEFP